MDVLEDKPITISEVAEILSKKEAAYEKSGVEVLYEQRKSLEHARRYSKLDAPQSRDLVDKLAGLDLGLSQERSVKIVDLLPETVDDVRMIFAKERFKYTEDDIKQILDLVDQYR